VFIKDSKLIYSELFILKRKGMENGGGGGQLKKTEKQAFAGKTHVIFFE
jgi:hypothetical protein